jgi:hypothetical protein
LRPTTRQDQKQKQTLSSLIEEFWRKKTAGEDCFIHGMTILHGNQFAFWKKKLKKVYLFEFQRQAWSPTPKRI